MKKHLTALVAIFVFVTMFTNTIFAEHSTIDCSKLPKLPNPPSVVNDFASILDEQTKGDLIVLLDSFYKETSITLCVVTIQSLEGNEVFDYCYSLANCWKVGDAANRGALILISPNDRKMYICVSYELEKFLTDYDCKHVIENNFRPLFKAGDYPAGIKNGMDAIISVLGRMSWEDRMDANRLKQLNEEKVRQKESEDLQDFIIGALVLIVIAALVFLTISYLQKRKKRVEAKSKIALLQKEIQAARALIEKAKSSYNNQPSWARREMELHLAIVVKNITLTTALVKDVSKTYKKDPEEALASIFEGNELIESGFKSFKRLDQDLRVKITKFSTDAPVKHAEAMQKIGLVRSVVESQIKKGYKFEGYLEQADKLLQGMNIKGTVLKEKEAHKEIVEYSNFVVGKLEELLQTVKSIVTRKEEIDNELPATIKECKDLFDYADERKKTIRELKLIYPENVWLQLESDFAKLVPKISPEKLSAVKEDISFTNSFEKQRFEQASIAYNNLLITLKIINQLYVKIIETDSMQQKAKNSFNKKRLETEKKVSDALKVVKDSDVGTEAKNLSKKSSQQLEKAKNESGMTLVDWILIIAILQNSENDATAAIKQADDDIYEAERRRKKKAAEAAAAEQRRRDEDSYSSSSSFSSYSSSSSSSSSSGSGGFGGGSFGGGGAGGSW